MSISSWLCDLRIDGKLPLPSPVIQFVLDLALEVCYRFAPTYDELPDEWSGASGPIARKTEDLMRVHYDKPAILFESFLDKDMKYSAGLWERGAADLDAAQEAMLEDFCAKANIQDGDNVLDIGCGFGNFAAYVLRRYPACKVTGITLSTVQYDWISEKRSEPGHPLHNDRFRVLKEDFAHSQFAREFDRVVSIGLFEHINNIELALEKIAGFLKPEGTCMLHYICYHRLIGPFVEDDSTVFFERYIFPGGHFWPMNELPRYGEYLKVAKSWFLNGNNYRRTLKAWRANFWKNIGRIKAHPDLDDRFVRVWDLYLQFCMAMFRGMGGRNVGNGQFLLRHARPVA